MGKCLSYIEEVRIITRHPELTEVYVYVYAEGDCPLGVQGWHHKTFPASKSVIEILKKDFSDHLLWPLDSPNNPEDL
ncbi:MAG: hypothetical protein KGQ83_09875 [Planctomycetes bacterium]|nr:hypothetical protein [Planctomycetota bacterium]